MYTYYFLTCVYGRGRPLANEPVFSLRARGCFRERRAAAMLYRVLFTVVALLAATQAQEDPCLGEDYAEAHCARLPACTAWTLASA